MVTQHCLVYQQASGVVVWCRVKGRLRRRRRRREEGPLLLSPFPELSASLLREEEECLLSRGGLGGRGRMKRKISVLEEALL